MHSSSENVPSGCFSYSALPLLLSLLSSAANVLSSTTVAVSASDSDGKIGGSVQGCVANLCSRQWR